MTTVLSELSVPTIFRVPVRDPPHDLPRRMRYAYARMRSTIRRIIEELQAIDRSNDDASATAHVTAGVVSMSDWGIESAGRKRNRVARSG